MATKVKAIPVSRSLQVQGRIVSVRTSIMKRKVGLRLKGILVGLWLLLEEGGLALLNHFAIMSYARNLVSFMLRVKWRQEPLVITFTLFKNQFLCSYQ